jgi:hypothetical protein
MFFGFTVLFVIVTVVVFTAPDGVVLGLVGPGVELDPEELPHAPMTSAAAAARAAARKIPQVRVLRIRSIRPEFAPGSDIPS